MHMFTVTLNKTGGMPLYEQLYQYIKEEITRGRFSPGEKLPSKRKLAAHLKISQNTIETAYAQLQAEGYIRSLPKQGFFVEEIAKNLPLRSSPKTSSLPSEYSLEKPYSKKWQYDFKTNIVNTENFPFDTWSKIVRSVLAEKREKLLHPLPFLGDLQLRGEIARYLYAYRDIQTTPEQIMVGAGSEYLLSLVIQFFGADCPFAIENPGYDKIQRIFQNHHLPIDYINTTQESLDIKRLSRSTAKVLHITPSHHFPLGCVMPIQIRRQALNWANEKDDRYIIEDDYDSEFRFAGKPIPALASLDQNEKVIYLNTFTKSLAPSLRISYLVLPRHLMEQFSDRFSGYASTVPGFEQATLAAFMARGHFERHINRMKRIYKEQRDMFIQTVNKHPLAKNIAIIGQETGLHLLLQVNLNLSEKELVTIARQKDIHITDLSSYYHEDSTDMPTNTIVLGYSGLSLDEIRQGINLLLDSWQQAIGK